MSVAFQNSCTKVNLMRAFAGESQARNRYTIAAGIARQQGFYSIADVFDFTANQERAHAAVFYGFLKELDGETIAIEGGYPVNLSDSLVSLLVDAQHNEEEEHQDVYQAFAKTAQEEGFPKIAGAFKMIADVEKTHAERFALFAKLLKEDKFDHSDTPSHWMCLECGYIHKGTTLPERCPACDHSKGHFIPLYLAPYVGCNL